MAVLPLRFPWVWMSLGWLLLAGVVLGSLLPGSTVSAVALQDKLLHAGSYFVLMIWFAGLYERRRHIVIALGLLGLGAVLDALQGSVSSRSFEWLDVAANGAGVALGLGLSLWLLGGWCQRVERYLA